MPLVLKKSFRENIKDLPVLIDDKSTLSPSFFRVSDVPQILTKGKNLLRISGHPTNLKEGTQILIDVRDSNGNDIYYEIPDYIEDDKSRLISLYIYHDKGDDNTPNGEAIITLIGVATKTEDGSPIPPSYKDKYNVRWQVKVNVDRDRKSITPIIFNPLTKLPNLSISESIEVYKNQPQSGNKLNRTTQTGKVRYILKGRTPIVQITDGTTFNQEMHDSSIVLSNYTEPATPISKERPTNLTFFSGSISKVLNSSTILLEKPYTGIFRDREGLKHTYNSIEESDYTIQYVRSGSNVTTENQRSFVNLAFTDVDPIAGVVDKVKVLQKSDGLPGEFELLNEVAVPFSSSFSVKIPMPSENLQDPKLLKIQYLNSIGEISRTETLSSPFVFAGGNQYIGGSQNLISGSLFISNTLGTGLEIGGASSGFMRSVGFKGQTSASLGTAPGGFVIYSGSNNLKMGADVLQGVGMQFIGDNDDRHLIFSTADGGILDVKTDKFFIGTNTSQFISGSDSNIEISSSLFHLDPKNNSLIIGADATIEADLSVNNIFTPSGTNINTAKAAITQQGFAKFTSGSIGGLKLVDNKLFAGSGTYNNSNTGFYVDSGSNFSLGNKLVWNPSTQALVVRGQLQLSDGSDVGTALAEATSSNTSKTVSLGASSYVITFNALGNQDPTGQTITLTATQQNHVGTVYYEFRKGGSLQGARGTSNTFVADQSSELPTASTPVTYEVKTFEVASGGSAIANDTLTLFGVQAAASGSDGSDGSDGTDGTDGTDAVTAFLTNEAHTFAANPDKSIVSLTGGSTDMIVFEGVTDKTTSYTYSRSSTTSVSSSISSNTVTVTSMGHDSGSIIITATSASTSLSKTMSLSKAIAGQTGSDGADGADGAAGLDGTSAKTLVASIDSQVMAFDDSSDTSATPTEVIFSFNQQNLNAAIGSSDITISTAGGNVTNFGFDNNSVTNSSGKHSGISSGSISFTGALNSGGLNSTKSNFPVTISVTKDGLSDSIKLFKVEGGADGAAGSDGSDGADGTDAVTTFLTNESHTFTAESDGTIISFVGGSTDMEVFEGVTNSTSNYTISSSRGPGVTATDSGKTVTISGMTHDSGSVTITATSASVSLSKTMSLTKSKQGTAGLAGSDAKLLSLSSDSQVFSFPSASSSTAIDNDILITINQQNLSGTVTTGDFTIVDANGATLSDPTLKASVTDGTGQVSGSITFSGTVGGNKTKLPLTVTVSKDSLEDSLKIFKVEGGSAGSDGTDGADGSDGADAVTAFLTNESHTFPADSTGAIASFVGGSTEMEVFEGITNRTSNYTISSSRGPGVTATDNGKKVTISGLTHDSGSVTITATSASVSLSKTMSLTKAKQGSDGSDGTSAKLLIGSLDSQVFAFDNAADSSSDPLEIFFSFQQQNLSAAIVAGDLTITTAGGSNITNFDFNNSDISSGTGIVSGSIVFSQALNNGGAAGSKSNLPIQISATKDGLQDSVKIFKVEGGTAGADGADGSDGEDARVMILTNESHTFAAQPNGNIISFTGGDTDVSIFKGITNTTSNYSISATSTTSVSSSVSSNTVTVTSMGHDSGSLIITAVSASGASGEVSLSKLMSLTKAKQGTDGQDGTDGTDGLDGSSAKILTITSDSQVFGFDDSSDNSATPSSIIFTITQQNLAHTIDTGDITITKAGGSTLTTPSLSGTISSGTGQQTFTVPFSSLAKSDLPLTVSVSNNANNLSDSTKVFKVEGGSDGATGAAGADGSDGSDAVTAFLTNEAHTFAALNNGTVVSFVGGSTDMEVFEGVTNRTSNYTISSSRGPGVTATDSGNTVTITALAHDSGSVSITATSASVSLTKTMSLVKSKQGTAGLAGANAKSVSIVADSQTFAFDNSVDTTATPSSINFTVNQQNLSGTIGTSDITITKAGGSAFTTPSLGGSVSNGTGTRTFALPFSSFSKTDLPLSISVSKDSLNDSTKIFKVQGGDTGSDGAAGADGTSAVTAFLTNESHTFAADFSGSIASFVGGSTDMEVFEGVTNVTSNYTISSSRGPGVVASDSGNTVTVTALSHDSGSLNITATSASVSLTKTMSLVKSRQGGVGATGADGSNAKTITVGAASQIFVKAQNGTISPSSIVITANGQNLTQAGSFSTTAGTLTSTSTSTSGGSTTVTSANFVDGMVVTYTTAGADGSLTDSITLKELDEGSGTVSALLTNEAHVLPASSAGAVSSYSDSGTSIDVYEGATQLDYDGSGTTNGHWTIGTPTVSPSGKITVGSISDSTNTAVVGNHSSMANDTDSVTITYPISGKTQNGTSFSFNKTQTLTKSKAGSDGAPGAAGSDSKTVSLTAASNVITYNAAGSSPSPSSTITLTATSQNFTNGFFKFTGDGISDETSYTDGSGANSDTFTFSVPSSYFSTPKSIRVGVAEGNQTELAFDTVSIVAVQPGSDGAAGSDGVSALTAFLTSDGDIVPAANDGTVSSFVGSGTEMIIFQGATDVSSAFNTVTRTNSTGLTSTLSGKTLTITGLTADSGSVVITATSASGDPGQVQISKTYSIGKSKAGATGDTGAAGSNAKTVTVGAASQIFVKAQNGTISPSSIVITANGQNLTQAGSFSTTAGTLTSKTENTSGGSATVTSGNFVNGMVITYTAHSNDGSISDSVTLKELDEGSGAITAILDNEAHVLPASSDGVVSSYSNSGTKISVFEGATALDYDASGTTNGHWTVSTSQSPSSTITIGSISDSTNDAVVGNHSSMVNGTDSVTISYAITGKTLNGTSFSFTKTQTLTKAKTGATGPQGNDNQDFSFLDASLDVVNTSGGLSAGLLMTSNVFGFHNAISAGDGTNATLADFTSFLDSGGSFYLGGNSSGATNPTDGYFAWNNTDKSLLISGSKARIDVDKFFVGKSTTQFISGSNGNIEISSSKFHIKPDGDIIVKKVTADDGTIGGFSLGSTQINSSNNNLILKASGQVTASTLLLTGGSVAGMPVSSDEISVGEILKLKQSGQITGSSVQFSGGNIGGFQLENSSLYQGIGGDLIASASFTIRPKFGDYTHGENQNPVAPFAYEPRLGTTAFYIENIETNLPSNSDLGLILKTDSIISGSIVSGATAGLFSSGSNYYNNSTHLAAVGNYDPVSQLLTLKSGFNLGYWYDLNTTRRIYVVNGVTYTTANGAPPQFNQSSKTTSFTIPQKDISNLILSSSGELTAQSGKIGDFTISGTDIELITSIESKAEQYDFRVYNKEGTSWPSDAIANDEPSDNGGKPLVLHVGGEDWEVARIINAGANGSDEGFGYYLAISSSARSSSNKVYDKSQLEGLGMNVKNATGQFVFPFNQGTSGQYGAGYSFIPPTTNKFGKNESWYLEYFGGEQVVKSGDVGYENATISFVSQSTTISKVESLIFAATQSFISNDANSPILIQQGENDTDILSILGRELTEGTFRQSLYIDGLGGKAELFGKSNVSNWILSQADSNKLNFWETNKVGGGTVHGVNRTLPNIPGLSLESKLTIPKSILNKMTGSVSASNIYGTTAAANAATHWTTTNQEGEKLEKILDKPFLYFGRDVEPGAVQKIFYSILNGEREGVGTNSWANTSYTFEQAAESAGAKLSATASVSWMPYYPLLGNEFINTNGADPSKYEAGSSGESHGKYAANAAIEKTRANAEEYVHVPGFISSSELGSQFKSALRQGETSEYTVEHIQPKNVDISNGSSTTTSPTSHIMVLAEGWYIHPLLDKAFQNKGNPINFPGYGNVGYQSGNGAVGDLNDTHKLLGDGTEETPDVNNAYPKNWLRFGSAYNHADILDGASNSTRKLRGLPLKVEHNITSGSYTLGSKAILKGGIFPTDVSSRGKFPANPSEENKTTQTLTRIYNDTSAQGPPVGSGTTITNSTPYSFDWNLNGLLDSNDFGFGTSEGDIGITNRISATVIDTDASTNFQNAFFDVVQKENDFDMPFSLAFAEKVRFGDGTIRMGTLSGSFNRGSVLKISGSGEISSSKYIQKSDGQVTGSKINFTGGKISGSDMTIFANEFDFKSTSGRVVGNETTFEISSSLLDLKPKSLDIKGNLQAEKVYGQDTFLAGKVVSTGVKNPRITTVKYNLPFVEAYSQDGSDSRLDNASVDFMIKGQDYNPTTTAVLSNTGSVIIGNHQQFALGGSFTNTPQYLVKVTNDGVGYPEEFKSWKDISGVNNDYVFVENSDARNAAQASGSLPTQLIGNQLVFNQATSSAIIFNGSNALTASNAFSTITTDNINLQDILSENSRGTHLQFGIRGTAHPSTGSFSGFNPEYKVEVISTSGSAESLVWEKSYKDTEATNASWAIFDIPLTDIVTTFTSESKYNQHQYLKNSVSGSDIQNIKVKISSRYSGSSVMAKRLQEGKRFGGSQEASGSFTLGFALTEMRLVEPVRVPALDTQTLHLKDTYLTWHDNPATTGHYGNFVPEHTTSTTASFSLGTSEEKWDDIYLNLKQDNIVSDSVAGRQVENKFVRMDVHSGKLTFTSASAGGGAGSSYSLPLAAAGTRGGVKIGYTENGQNYPVELSSEKMFVNVPWTDTNTDTNTFRTVNVRVGDITNTLGSTETLELRGGSNVSLTEAAGVVQISATDTNTNYYLDGITKSGNTLTFSVNGATNQTYTFGSNAFNSTAYLTSLPSHTHDDRYYTETEMQSFFNRGYINNQQASNLAAGWYTIAQNTGDRALGEFQIWDTSSGRHQSVVFNAAHHFGVDDSNSITVTANSSYSTDVFRYIRIKESGTYDGAAIQVYIDNTTNDVHVAIVGANAQESGWVLVDWLADASAPSLISNWENATEKSKIDLDIVHTGGIATTGKIYVGGATTQYEVYHTNNLTPLTIGTTSTTALAGNTTVNDVSVANLKTRLAGGFGSNAVTIGDSSDTVTIAGNLNIAGTLDFTGTAVYTALDLNNNNITGVNHITINDPGPNEGISWNGGNTKIYESPNDLTTNSAGNLQFVYGSTRRMSVTNTGAEVNGAFTISGLAGTGNRMVIANASGVLSTQAIPSGGGGGISFDGSTADGILTYKDSDEATVESGLTWASGYYLTSHTNSGGGRVRFGAGSASSPTYSFAGDTDTGFYLPATGEIAGVLGGSERVRFAETGLKLVSSALGVNVNASATNGRIDASNDIVAYSTSDERLKENVKTIDSSLSKVLQIRGVEFDWKELTEEEKKTIHGNEGHDVGVIAQEIEKVLPEVVTERENGYKAVKYEKIVPLLIEAIKEQSDTIEKLTERINKLEKGSNN